MYRPYRHIFYIIEELLVFFYALSVSLVGCDHHVISFVNVLEIPNVHVMRMDVPNHHVVPIALLFFDPQFVRRKGLELQDIDAKIMVVFNFQRVHV